MERPVPIAELRDEFECLVNANSMLKGTLGSLPPTTNSFPNPPQPIIRPLITVFLAGLLAYKCIKYLTSDLPPLGSGLKRLPGPISTLPYFGRVHDIDRATVWKDMKRFSDQYDGVFSLNLAGDTHIWIAKEDMAQDLLCKNASICSGRNDFGAYPDVTQDYKYLPLIGYTEYCIRQRRFAHTMMTRHGSRGFNGYVELEGKRLMKEMVEAPGSFYDLIHIYTARISSRLAYGTDESAPEHLRNAKTFINQIGPAGPIQNVIPFLKYFPEFLVPDKRKVRDRQEWEARLWNGLFQDAKEKYKLGTIPENYVGASLETTEGGDKGQLLFQDEMEATYAVGMLCIVAIFTIAGPIIHFVQAMLLHPEWHKKIYQEIQEVVGDEMVEWKHTPSLPTLRAAMKECLRWRSPVPLGVPRLLEKDYSYDGYHFPKNAIVHVLDVALCGDEERYRDATAYNPGRWLTDDSPNFKSPLTEYPRIKGHHVFGRGKRICPGQDLVEAEMFVACGNLAKNFVFSPKLDSTGAPIIPDPDRWTPDVIGGPLPFDCDIKVRDSSKLQTIHTLYSEAFVDS